MALPLAATPSRPSGDRRRVEQHQRVVQLPLPGPGLLPAVEAAISRADAARCEAQRAGRDRSVVCVEPEGVQVEPLTYAA